MKKVIFLACLILFFSCQEQEIVNPTIPVQDGKASRILPPGDPNLNPNWNWEGSQWNVYFTNIGGSVGSAGTVNPFYNDAIFGNADPSKIDIRAADGWMLVARDFGTSTAAPRFPWIMLYNRYRGLLRVCVLRTADLLSSYQLMTLSFDNSVAVPQSFRFTGETEQQAVTKAGSLGWMVGEFNVQGYDPSINQQARFRVNMREVATNNITLNGGLSIDGVAQPKPSKKSLVETTYEVSTHSSKLWDKLPELGGNFFKNIVKNISKNPFDITGAAAGLIKSFTSAGKAPTYNISLEGDVSLSGSMTLDSPRGSIEVYLRSDANNSGQYKALRSIPWGVMNYTGNARIDRKRVCESSGGRGGLFCEWEYSASSSYISSVLSINPAIAGSVSKTEVGIIHLNENNVFFRNISSFFYRKRTEYNRPVAVAVRITFTNGDVVYNRIPIRWVFI